MSTYAIGDIQGCYHTLKHLLKRIAFNPQNDKLWLTGDLVNRGLNSLEVLRWAFDSKDNIVTVLGNHDLYLLARAYDIVAPKKKDTLEEVIKAPDIEKLLEWLRKQPFVYRENDLLLVHAGLHPLWTCKKAKELALEVEEKLQSSSFKDLLETIFQKEASPWDESLSGLKRLHSLTNILTRIRTCTLEGQPTYEYTGSLKDMPEGQVPWFKVSSRKSRDCNIIFGHWKNLGLHLEPGIMALDSGCVWGNTLTALRLEDKVVFQEPKSPDD